MDQVRTEFVSVKTIMRKPEFARGLEDVRNGRAPDFDSDDEYWAYERGRLFGRIAPVTMPLRIQRKLNPKAVALYRAAIKRRLIP
jgi:hypothetical protein